MASEGDACLIDFLDTDNGRPAVTGVFTRKVANSRPQSAKGVGGHPASLIVKFAKFAE
jgi:hypothetical protein